MAPKVLTPLDKPLPSSMDQTLRLIYYGKTNNNTASVKMAFSELGYKRF